ncbi:MAG TPA: hypothetical protein GX524_06310 [Firmicutes bacterium]|nr:hypothetical protein [Bacillota bacterium]
MKNWVPLLITFFIGAIMMIEFFFVAPWAGNISGSIRSWTPMITAFTVVVGTVNLILVHGKNVSRKTSGWYKSILLLVSFLVTIGLGLTVGQKSDSYMFIFDNILNATGSTMFALTAFYIGSSAFRAFRAMNMHATILLISGALVMLGRVPIGEYVSKSMPDIAQWIMDIPNVAGQRGIMIAMGIGFVSQCLRVLLGYSRRHLGAIE